MKDHILKPLVGIIAPGAGITVSFAAQLEIWLRITSLCIGIMVGIATLVSIVLGILKNHKKT
jgi:hypothetical protein